MPIGFILAAISPFLLRIFDLFQPSSTDVYASGAPIMAVIAVSIALTAVSAVYSSSLLVDDKAHHFAISTVIGLASLVAVAFVTVPSQGAVGIAYARGAMLFVSLGFMAFFVGRAGRLVLDRAAYLKSLGASVIMAIIAFGLLDAASRVGLGRVAIVLASMVMVPVGFGIYLLVMKLMKAFAEEDLVFLESLLPVRLGIVSRIARKFL